jgi:hypothetical protein
VAAIGNVNEILDGHVVLDLECLDRIYLNAYVPKLQVGGQVVTFFSQQNYGKHSASSTTTSCARSTVPASRLPHENLTTPLSRSQQRSPSRALM